ncbi:unnamed protein product [Urochloa humidicola]
MAAAPEEFLFVHPEPPSPSVFLDLPPTPPRDQDGEDPGAFDDMVLPYVARLLMDADEDSFFYQYPDHPALLQAQMPFAQILAEAGVASSSSSSGGTTTTSPSLSPDSPGAGGHSGSDSDDHSPTSVSPADMVTSAFLKGMQEAAKLLPTIDAALLLDNSSLDHARGRKSTREHAAADAHPEPEARRAAKLVAASEPDEADARRMFDEMMLHDREICMKGVQQQQQGSHTTRRRRRRTSTANETAVDLHALLLRCAQAVSTDDRRGAHDLLAQVRRHASPTGDAAQRMSHYFAEGLEARLAGTGSRLYQSLMVRPTSTADFLKAYQLFMAACCCKKVAFAFSNKTIFDAVSGRKRLHIVDYGIGYGFQWPGLLRGLAARHGGPPEVRITGIDLPQPGFRPARHIEDTGRRLADCARHLGVPFTFRAIAAPKKETISTEDLHIADDEVLVVSSLCHFRHLMMDDESVVVPGRRPRSSPRDEVLGNIRRMRPDVFIHGVINGGYGTTYFPTRFRELLFHYAAQFDLLDATVARDSHERMLVERDIFGSAAVNVIACEGADRVERPETYKQWHQRNKRAGLKQLPLTPEVVKVVLDKVRDNYHKDFVVDQDHHWLLHRWKGRVLYGLSTWVAAHDDAATSLLFSLAA